ncbi:hypothetical protein HK405_006808, partial [Cladochytrium tenue]
MDSTTQVGFVGLGAMGAPMALNMQAAISAATGAPPLLVWNRTAARCDAAVAAGARRAESVAAVAAAAHVLFCMTFDDANLLSVAAEAAAAGGVLQVFVSCSTVDPEATAKAAALLNEKGVK